MPPARYASPSGHQVDVVVAHLQRIAHGAAEEVRQPCAGGLGDHRAQQVDAGRAVHRLVPARLAHHRQRQRVAVPVGLRLLALHGVLVAGGLVVAIVAGQARGHRHQVGHGDAGLARIAAEGIAVGGQHRAQRRVRRERLVLRHRQPHQQRREGLAGRAAVVRPVGVEAVEVALHHQLAAMGDQQRLHLRRAGIVALQQARQQRIEAFRYRSRTKRARPCPSRPPA